MAVIQVESSQDKKYEWNRKMGVLQLLPLTTVGRRYMVKKCVGAARQSVHRIIETILVLFCSNRPESQYCHIRKQCLSV
jgi:hypothetical protein